METTAAFVGLSCTDCGESFTPEEPGRCPSCDAPLSPTYDYGSVSLDPETLAGRRFDTMWRYRELLPFTDPVTANEGATPLVDAPELAADLDVERVLVKDEGRNPTGTVHDRGLSPAVTAARAHGVEPLALATPGNAGQSAAAYAGRAGLRSYAFVPSRSPFSNKAMVNVHGGKMRVVGGRYPDALAALHSDLETDWHSLQEFTTPYRHDGVKTLAFEVAESLDWTVPDAVVTPCGSGEVVVGLATGFRALEAVGLTAATPAIYAVQPEGCAPIATAWERDIDRPEPWEFPDTIVGELEIPDPAGGDLALDALRETGGEAIAVPDADILEAAVDTTERVGVEMGAAGGAAAAGASALADQFGPDDTVVVVNTESGVKTADVLRSHLMGKGI